MKRSRRFIVLSLVISIACVLAGIVAYAYRHDLLRTVERASLPTAVEYSPQPSGIRPSPLVRASVSPASVKAPTVITPASSLPAEVNLAIPFTAQAPHANWEAPYKEFCEEASVLMAYRYTQGQSIVSPDDASQAMLDMWNFEQSLGYSDDTDIVQTSDILTKHLGFNAIQIIEDPSAHDIRVALASGKPVIVPAAGRLLGNPYFQNPGPLYHMLVIKGYTSDGRFITNDPGTRRGADFIYEEVTLMNAIHDWRTDENILQGRKVMLVVG